MDSSMKIVYAVVIGVMLPVWIGCALCLIRLPGPAVLFFLPCAGRDLLFAGPAVFLFGLVGGKGPDQVPLALAPPVVVPRQDTVDGVQVVRQAQLRVLCLRQPFFTSLMVMCR